MSLGPSYAADHGQWICGRCGVPLESGGLPVFYLYSDRKSVV